MSFGLLGLKSRIAICWLAIAVAGLSPCRGKEQLQSKESRPAEIIETKAIEGRQTSAAQAAGSRLGNDEELRRRLWRARIVLPTIGETSTKSREGFLNLVRRIRSVEFKQQVSTSKPNASDEQPALQEQRPEKAQPVSTEANEPAKRRIRKREAAPAYVPVAEGTLKTVRQLLQEPDKLENPLKLAEVLFVSGNMEEAALCYREALERKDSAESHDVVDRAWILFQLGNCLGEQDPGGAKQMYKQLIAEYPESPWVDPAKARAELMDWYLQDKPKTLMEKSALGRRKTSQRAAGEAKQETSGSS